jgi:DNA-3-methyladenine glycosylase I
MTGPVVGDDGVPRCPWGDGSPVMRAYHDDEWGRPVVGESALFERLTLEAFQSGLSWSTILNKREAFREVFHNFEVDRIARYDDTDVARLMDDARIVRNRAKILATIQNAGATVRLREAEGIEALIGGFAPLVQPQPANIGEVPTVSEESKALSRELKRRGFTFVGPTTMHALMEATGMVNTHLVGCHRR